MRCIVATRAQRYVCTVYINCLHCGTLDMELPKLQSFPLYLYDDTCLGGNVWVQVFFHEAEIFLEMFQL